MVVEKVGCYKILPDKKLIIEYYSGTIDVPDLMDFKNIISEDPDHNFYFNTLIDFRDAKLVVGKKELDNILTFFRKKFKPEGIRNVAYLTSTPNEVVLTKLFSLVAKTYTDLNFNLQTFSTVSAASAWFRSVTVAPETLENALWELKNSSRNVFQNDL